jgi:hypothetical protein
MSLWQLGVEAATPSRDRRAAHRLSISATSFRFLLTIIVLVFDS